MRCPDSVACGDARLTLRPGYPGRRAAGAGGLLLTPCIASADAAQAAAASGAALAPWLLVAALLAALAAACVWLVLRERRLGQRLRQVRQQQRALSDLLDVWQWRTDAEHRVTGLRPPAGATASRWSGRWIGQPLWDLFPAAQAEALRARLEANAPLAEVEVSIAPAGAEGPQDGSRSAVAHHGGGAGPAHSAAAARGRLSGVALTDAQGVFSGYLGIVREPAMPASVPAGAAAKVAALAGLGAVPVPTAAAPQLAAAPSTPASAPVAAPAATHTLTPVPAGPRAAAPERLPDPPAEAVDESFIYTLSHDLRAPIRVIDGFARILKEDYGHTIDRIGNDHIDRVLGASSRMSAMIDALLRLYKLSSQPIEQQTVNLSQLAAYVGEDLRRQSPQRAVELHVEPGLQAHGDPTLLRMVLENLLGNAWKYTGKRDDAQIWFERKADGGRQAFTVRDNGAGFDMRFADRLFGAFQRLHSASEFQGTGVGLVSVRRIVRRHGGEIWAEAVPGQGARFHFTLPGPDAAAAAPRAQRAA